ncbi:Fe-S cluster assembly protein SufB [Candidatus Dojkabacteria bacterium]|nr:Fe-S cluster assembly protein SufB [Candidatus Dojkabacteria bacterium]
MTDSKKGKNKVGSSSAHNPVARNSSGGLSEQLINEISDAKAEPSWMRDYRLMAYRVFKSSKLPEWVPSGALNRLDFDKLNYFIRPVQGTSDKWEDLPDEIRQKYYKLGIPEVEQKFLAGLGAQLESEMVYHSIKADMEAKGVIFLTTSEAIIEYPDLVRKYFGKLVSPENNMFAALNAAIWSGGSFIYIPPGVYITSPLHNFFQMETPSQGQFERTIIVVDKGSSLEFIEGCVAPLYSDVSLHSGVVEIFVEDEAKVKFSTMQNWSKNVLNLVTKKAIVGNGASVEWIDGNVGSGLTMKYPTVRLEGKSARAKIKSLAFAGSNQIIDAGAKVFHNAPDTKSVVEARSLLRKGGRSTFRGEVTISENAADSQSRVECISLLMEGGCRADTYPVLNIENPMSQVEHESSVIRIREEQLRYLRSRGFTEEASRGIIVGGFIESFTEALPLEYSVEFSRLIDIEIGDGSK